MMQDLRLPKFDKNRRIIQQQVLVFDNNNVKYGIILGNNILSKAGIMLNYSEGNMEWFDCSTPLCPCWSNTPLAFVMIIDKHTGSIQIGFIKMIIL